MGARSEGRSDGGKVAAVHMVDVEAFLTRTSEQGLETRSECAVCAAPLEAARAGAYKRLGASLVICCEAPACIATFVQ